MDIRNGIIFCQELTVFVCPFSDLFDYCIASLDEVTHGSRPMLDIHSALLNIAIVINYIIKDEYIKRCFINNEMPIHTSVLLGAYFYLILGSTDICLHVIIM